MKKTYFYEFLIFSAASLWGIISLFSVRITQMGFAPIQFVTMRTMLASVTLALIILIKDKKLFAVKLKDIPIFLGSGILSFLLLNVCYMTSINVNGSAVAAMLMYTSPVWIIIISRLVFREKITIVKIISLIGVLIGCALVSLGGEMKLSAYGLLLGLGSGIGYALYSIFGKLASEKNYSPETTTFYTFLFAFIASIPFSDFGGAVSLISADASCLIYFLLSAELSTVAPYILYTAGLKGLTPGKAGLISVVELIVAAIVGVIAFPASNKLDTAALVGMALVIGSLVFLETKKEK